MSNFQVNTATVGPNGIPTLNGGVAQQIQEQINRKPLSIENDPIEFDGLMKSKLTTTVDLCKVVNGLFKPVLSDCEGSIILPNQYGVLELVLWFKEMGNPIGDKIKSLMPAGAVDKNATMMDRIRTMDMRNRLRTYDLTQDAQDILSEFIYVPKGKQIKWSDHMIEQTQQNYNGYTVYVKLIGLDLMKVLRKIYGNKLGKSYVDYSVTLMRRVGMDLGVGNYGSQNFLINIVQLDNTEAEKIAASVGLIPSNGQIPIIR